ncbi:dihydrodipicolinate synthase family protein [Ruania rhizosphaerae]|uniref:dihydrodipicolinate synthase family protein n=1 Tax=Ruania rhizosphaerae TaxID=1840413 RepID=UPI00135CDE91|nr:dihydrodipicolinate synthase family protein [Ruania rhizosphaerae]
MHSQSMAGVIPVLATPFHPDGSLDRRSLTRLVEFQVDSGAAGVATFGMASETFTLTATERRQILGDVVASAGELPIVAGVGATGLSQAREQLRDVADQGAHVAMVLPPFMVTPSSTQLLDFYGALATDAQAAGIEIMVQDAPGATGVAMSAELIADLAQLPAITSVKVEASPTLPKLLDVQRAMPVEPITVMGGQNAQFFLDELACGAAGTMPACEFTDLLVEIYRAWTQGERARARSHFALLLPLIVWGLQSGPAWAIHKEVLLERGIISAATVRAPARTLHPQMRTLLHEILAPLPLTPVRN